MKEGSGSEAPLSCGSDSWEATITEFRAHDHMLERVETFNYPDRILLFDDSDCLAVVVNLLKAHVSHGGR